MLLSALQCYSYRKLYVIFLFTKLFCYYFLYLMMILIETIFDVYKGKKRDQKSIQWSHLILMILGPQQAVLLQH